MAMTSSLLRRPAHSRNVIPHEMKKEKITKLILFLSGILLFGCISSKISIENYGSNIYTSKTYQFLGNSFDEYYNSEIDTLNFTWRDSFRNNQLVCREYPKYHGEFKRIEKYEYDKNNELHKTIIETFLHYGTTKDSTIYNKIDFNTTELTKYVTGENPFKEIHRNLNDTIFIDQEINGKYGFTSREFWVNKFRKQSQIVKPELSEVMNIYVHNENGDLIEIERYENGIFVYTTMSIQYKYDSQERIILKEIFYGGEDEKKLGSTEITIYD